MIRANVILYYIIVKKSIAMNRYSMLTDIFPASSSSSSVDVL
jgi:hypothetical protein